MRGWGDKWWWKKYNKINKLPNKKISEFFAAILIVKMEENMQYFQHIMLHYFDKGRKTTETHKKFCAVYGEGSVIDRMCHKWLACKVSWYHWHFVQIILSHALEDV